MAADLITWADKITSEVSPLPANQKMTAADTNQIKTSNNNHAGLIDDLAASDTLQIGYDNADGRIITDATNVAVKFRRGSGADTDKVFSIENGAGTEVASFLGNGDLTVSGKTILQNFSSATTLNIFSFYSNVDLGLQSGSGNYSAFRSNIATVGRVSTSGMFFADWNLDGARVFRWKSDGDMQWESAFNIEVGFINSMSFDASNNVTIPNGDLTINGGAIFGASTVGGSELVNIVKLSTSVAEGQFSLRLASDSTSTPTVLGFATHANYTFIQSMHSGTSFATKPLHLQPKGGEVIIGNFTPASLTVSGDVTVTNGDLTISAGQLTVEGTSGIIDLIGGVAASPSLRFYQGVTRRSFLQYVDSTEIFKIANEYGSIALMTAATGTEIDGLTIDTAQNVTIPNGTLTMGGNIALGGNSISNIGELQDAQIIQMGNAGKIRNNTGSVSNFSLQGRDIGAGTWETFVTVSNHATLPTLEILSPTNGTTTITADSLTIVGDGLMIPVGLDAARVATQGSIRYNTTGSNFEGYDGAAWQGLQGSVLKASVSVSSAELLAINTTPKTIISAPGAGKVIVVLAVSMRYTHVTTAYSGASGDTRPQLFFGGGNDETADGQYINIASGADTYILSNSGVQQSGVKADFDNQTIELTTALAASDPTLGDGTVEVSVSYIIMDI